MYTVKIYWSQYSNVFPLFKITLTELIPIQVILRRLECREGHSLKYYTLFVIMDLLYFSIQLSNVNTILILNFKSLFICIFKTVATMGVAKEYSVLTLCCYIFSIQYVIRLSFIIDTFNVQ